MAGKKKLVLDTNIIIRFLLADHPQLSSRAKRIFHQAEEGELALIINQLTVAEVVWVLTSFYRIKRERLVRLMLNLFGFPNVEVENKNLLIEVLLLFKEKNISFIDTYNLVWAKKEKVILATFDKKLAKINKE